MQLDLKLYFCLPGTFNLASLSAMDISITETQPSQVTQKSLRVSSKAKINALVAEALKYLLVRLSSDFVYSSLKCDKQDPASGSLLLHTQPNSADVARTSHHTALHKLISVIEIVKREYTKAALAAYTKSNPAASDAEDAAPSTSNGLSKKTGRDKAARRLPAKLFQYNKLVNYQPNTVGKQDKGKGKARDEEAEAEQTRAEGEDEGEIEEGEEPSAAAIQAHQDAIKSIVIQGKTKRPKVTHMPVMSVILSTKKLDPADIAGWT